MERRCIANRNRHRAPAVPPTVFRGPFESGFALALMVALASLAACKPAPDNRWSVDPAAAERGRLVVERVQCGACHVVPGIAWPQGKSGPSLAGFSDRGLIAGELPNRPDVLAAFIRNAPAVKPGSPMPPMPVSEAEAADIAAFLYRAGRD